MKLTLLNQKLFTAAAQKYTGRVIVPGEGNPNAHILLIGEAPGGEEEKQKRPFVGSAGKNLNEFLEILELKREDIYISNVVKIRPFKLSLKTQKPINRPPDKNELSFFTPFLLEEIQAVRPRYVLTLGNIPLKALLAGSEPTIGALHGKALQREDYILFPLYHPASIIYRRELKEVYLEDLRAFKKIINENS